MSHATDEAAKSTPDGTEIRTERAGASYEASPSKDERLLFVI
jgi:hypothetical protein